MRDTATFFSFFFIPSPGSVSHEMGEESQQTPHQPGVGEERELAPPTRWQRAGGSGRGDAPSYKKTFVLLPSKAS